MKGLQIWNNLHRTTRCRRVAVANLDEQV